MRNLIGLCFLVFSLFVSIVHAQETSKTETFVGIGATLEKLTDGSIQIVGLIPRAPAEYSGLKIGDLIVAVKSLPSDATVDVRSLPLAEVVALIRGPVGVPVDISYLRGGAESSVISIIREVIEVDEVEDGE